METTERIVEAYVRYVKRWATIPNVGCPGQNEIDLLAIDPRTLDRYHIETSVSISSGFARLTGEPFDPERYKTAVGKPKQRRTLGFFVERKFKPPGVIDTLLKYGFEPGGYTQIIVSWGWRADVEAQAKQLGIQLWDFRKVVKEIAKECESVSTYFGDDTLRTLHLFTLARVSGTEILT
jgi:hypothetical protein